MRSLHILHVSPNIIKMESFRRIWAGRVERVGERRNAYMVWGLGRCLK
jgi:hypothetical protein